MFCKLVDIALTSRVSDRIFFSTIIRMIEHGDSKDILGRAHEYCYCLSKFAEQEDKLAGEFYTPSCVVRTLVEVLQPFNGRVYEIPIADLIQSDDSSKAA